MPVIYKYKKEFSPIFGTIFRPVARVLFLSRNKIWVAIRMIVDTGADYTLLPRSRADDLGINVEKESEQFVTFGVGGAKKVNLLRKIQVKLGQQEREIPVGFLDGDDVPPLLGRQGFMETFNTSFFKNHTLRFE